MFTRKNAAFSAAAIAVGASLILATAGSAAAATLHTVPGDVSGTNFSGASTKWDAVGAPEFSALPAAGSKWVLDIENKPVGTWTVDDDGLTLSVTDAPINKVRFQYYVGTDGYPAIDALDPTLSEIFDSPLGWDQTLNSGNPAYGITLQVQLQKQVSPGVWDRVTVVSIWQPGSGARNFNTAGPIWFANTPIHATGYLTGAVVSGAGSGVGVEVATLEANFGDWDVVSFGPNLGRDLAYSYTIQDFDILGQEFHFAALPLAVPTPTTPAPTLPAMGSEFQFLVLVAGALLAATGAALAVSVRHRARRA